MADETICYGVVRQISCEREAGHNGKHRAGGVTWTDQGAARIAKEDAEAVAKTKETKK
jgi:hypothetical protein